MRAMRFTRRQFLGMAAGVTALSMRHRPAFALGGQIVPRKDGDPSYLVRFKIDRPSRFRILQVTDLHFFAGKDQLRGFRNPKSVEDLAHLVKRTEPDLVMATGDLWPDNDENAAEGWMRYAIQQFEALNVPWGFTWGNHDVLSDYTAGHEAFTAAKNSLYRGATTDGNYVIDVVDTHGKSVWQLVCLNSHGDGLQEKERQWLRTMADDLKRVSDPAPPRFAFFHIPLKQYDEIWKNGAALGVRGEDPCIEKEDGSTLPVLKSLGVRACFCGHDHRNDYSGVIDGVELVYGRATGAGGYGGELLRKGGKLIALNTKSTKYSWVTIFPDGTKWVPKPGERVDRSNPVKS